MILRTLTASAFALPIFSPFRAAMRWRCDLLDYDNVTANAQIIWGRTSPEIDVPMPPPAVSLAAVGADCRVQAVDGRGVPAVGGRA